MSIDYENRKPVISMKGIKKEFSGVWALSGITFDVYAGEVHCLVGENGAGKSTLMKVLSGAYTPTAGSIEVDGKPIRNWTLRFPNSWASTSSIRKTTLCPAWTWWKISM